MPVDTFLRSAWVPLLIAALFILGWVLILYAAAMAWGADLGDGPGQVCLTLPVPAGFPPEVSFSSRRTLFPFGTECTFSDAAGAAAVVADGWANTAPFVAGVLLIAGSLALSVTRVVRVVISIFREPAL